MSIFLLLLILAGTVTASYMISSNPSYSIEQSSTVLPKYGVDFHQEWDYSNATAISEINSLLEQLRSSGAFWTRGDFEYNLTADELYWSFCK